jgi:LysR family glycine cleavage system transcriptional activator
MKSRLPPMHALAALEAFARLGNVGKAAEALGVTRSAVSHRLAMLEATLGFDVVKRSGKGVTLTPRGKRYANDVHKSLAILSGAQGDGDDTHISGVLRVSSTPGFASMWLCNHIASFHAEYPNLHLQITTHAPFDDVSGSDDVDVFVAFGNGNWPNYAVKHLYDMEFLPVCSPALLHSKGGVTKPQDLLRYPLLHLEYRNDWRYWLAENGVELPQNHVAITFSDMMLELAAAIAGQGIMIGDDVTCAGALSSGQLVAPFMDTTTRGEGYYLVSEDGDRLNPGVAAFTRWIDALIASVGALPRSRRWQTSSRQERASE